MNHIASPRTDDGAIEQEIQAKGKTAPRVTPDDIEANIASEHYFTAAQGAAAARPPVAYEFLHANGHAIVDYSEHTHVGHLGTEKGYAKLPLTYSADPTGPLAPLALLTFCVLVLRNGFTVTGESACASPENFDPEIGCKIARANAVNKIGPLMGYQLKEQLYQRTVPAQAPVEG
jgi:hypothetical protein